MKIKKSHIFILLLFIFCQSKAQDSLSDFSKQINRFYKIGAVNKSDSIFKLKVDFLKRQDNLEEFLYAHWDYFMLAISEERLHLISNIDSKIWRQPKTDDEHLARLHLWVNQAYHLKNFGKLHKSIIAYENAWNYYEKHPIKDYNIIDYCLKPLANNCTRIGDYSRAENVLKRTLQIAITSKNTHQISTSLSNLATCYHSQGKYDKANIILLEAMQLQKNDPLQQARLYSEMAQNHYSLGAYEKALQLIQLSNKELPTENAQSIFIKNLTSQSICYFYLKNTTQALQSIKKALVFAKKYDPINNREIAKLQVLKSKILEQNKQYTLALQSYQKALQTLLPRYKPTDIKSNPLVKTLYPENTFKEIFDGKATIFKKLQEYNQAISNYTLSFEIEDLLRSAYSSQSSKIIQQTENKNRSEQVLNLYDKMYQNNQENRLIEEAFTFVERSKSLVLWDELQSKYSRNNIKKDSLLDKEQKLVQKKASINSKIKANELAKNFDEEKLKKLLVEQDKTSNELQLVRQKINQKFPFTSASSFNKQIFQDLQKKLKLEQKSLVAYFVGKEQTYIFLIKNDKAISWRIIDNKAYQNTLADLLNYYSDNNGGLIVNELSRFKELSYRLYVLLLQPEISQINTNSLLIIPDALLSFIPFDALLTNETTSLEFQKFPFLLNDFTISYSYTTKILLQEKKREEYTHQFVGFFPVFKNRIRGLTPLTFTLEEANYIKNNFHESIYTEKEANLKQFIALENKSRIIHLSTHANIENNQRQTQIEFYDKPLSLIELYAHKIPADLVVLSACETGIGSLNKGEGAMSLARGFSYAGVKNLLVSLWQVNDKATSILMGNFYKQLADELPFEHALNQSKKQYLANSNISNSKKSPYYWAGFIPIQNTLDSFVYQTKTDYLYVYIALALLVFLAFLYLIKKKVFSNRQ